MEWSWLIGFDAKGQRAGDTNLDVRRRTVVVVVKALLNWAAPDAAADAMAEDRHVRLNAGLISELRPDLAPSLYFSSTAAISSWSREFKGLWVISRARNSSVEQGPRAAQETDDLTRKGRQQFNIDA